MSNRQAAKTPPGRFPLFWHSFRLFSRGWNKCGTFFSNRLQIPPISCIVADGKVRYFAFSPISYCHPMYSNRSMPPGMLRRKRKGKPLDRSCAHKTVPKQQKAVWAKASHCGLNREKTGNGRGNRGSVSRVQVRRTAVSAAFAAKRMNAWDELCFRIQGSRPPFCTCTKMAVFFSRDVCAPCSRSCMIYHRSLR